VAAVERQAATATRERWVPAEGTAPGGDTAIVLANAALKRIDYPFADQHLRLALGFGIERLSKGAVDGLDQAEDALVDALGACGTVYAAA
jgi:hypothetical protein